MTGVINAKGYYPLEKVLAPPLKLCFATCLTDERFGLLCFVMTF